MYIYQIMSSSFGYLDIILLGMIAGFIILRLRSILGRKLDTSPKFTLILQRKNLVCLKTILNQKKNLEILEGNDKKEFLKELR